MYLSTRDVWDRVDLWKERDDNNQWFGVSEGQCQPTIPEPVDLAECNHIYSLGKTDGKTLLTAKTNDCNNNNWLVEPDTVNNNNMYTGNWRFVPVDGKANTFNIIAGDDRKCDRRYLSVASGCGQTYVDVWTHDDNSGRQQWTVKRVHGQENVYTLTVGGRYECDRVHLSTRAVWNRADLWKSIDEGNKQYWSISQC